MKSSARLPAGERQAIWFLVQEESLQSHAESMGVYSKRAHGILKAFWMYQF